MHGGVACRRVQPPCIDLGDMGEDRGRSHAIVGDERRQITKENGVAEMGQREVAHESTCSRGISSEVAWITNQASMGVLLLYHDTFRRPQRLAAHTLEGRESFEIQCARSDCSRYARRPGDAVVRTRGESAIWPAK